MSTEPNTNQKFAAKHIPQWVFYVPFAYYFRVRLGTVAKGLSWALIYIFPTFFYSCLMAPNGLTPAFLCNYFLLLLAVFTLYETGYIANDTFATQREQQPSIRLYEHNLQHFYTHYRLIFTLRILLVFCVLCILLLLHFSTQWCITCIAVLCIAPLFFAYNRIRHRYNVFLYPFLVFSRYLPFLLPYLTSANAYLVGWLFLSFPCVNAIERFSMPKYRYRFMQYLIPDEQSKSLFRVAYYLLIALCATTIALCAHRSLLPIVPIYILCVYRVIIYIITRFYTPQNYLNG